jgi:hypothetical protein
VYPADCEVKRISASGFLAHEGKTYHVGEAFAHKRVGLRLDCQGQTGLYFANVHLGNRHSPRFLCSPLPVGWFTI